MEGEGGEMEEEKSVGDPERALYLLRYMEPIREQVKAEETAAAADDEGGGRRRRRTKIGLGTPEKHPRRGRIRGRSRQRQRRQGQIGEGWQL